MKAELRTGGFTMVEMMVSMLVASILALTVGSTLVFGYMAWRTDYDAVKAQSDSSLAMLAIGRQIRESGIDDIYIDGVAYAGNGYAIGSQIDFVANSVRSNQVSIVQLDDQLVMQPGGFVLVESGTLSDFTVQFNPEGPKVEVRLIVHDASGAGNTTVYSSFTPRN